MLTRFFLTACLVAVLLPSVSADDEGSVSPYLLETADKKFVFVMLKGGYRNRPQLYSSDKYPQSGMYRNDGSTIPLWTVDWSAYVILPSDGIHVIRRGPWPRLEEGYNAEAITFFANGKPLRSYQVRDLVDCPWLLPQTASHYRWEHDLESGDKLTRRTLSGEAYETSQGVTIDDDAGTMKMETLTGESYVFDYRTGRILSANRPIRFRVLLMLVMFLPLYAVSLSRSSAEPQCRWSVSLKRIALYSLLIVGLAAGGVMALLTFGESLFRFGEGWFRVEALLQPLEKLLLTLLFLPETFLLPGMSLRNLPLMIAWVPLFWFLALFIAGLLHQILVRGIRFLRYEQLPVSGERH